MVESWHAGWMNEAHQKAWRVMDDGLKSFIKQRFHYTGSHVTTTDSSICHSQILRWQLMVASLATSCALFGRQLLQKSLLDR